MEHGIVYWSCMRTVISMGIYAYRHIYGELVCRRAVQGLSRALHGVLLHFWCYALRSLRPSRGWEGQQAVFIALCGVTQLPLAWPRCSVVGQMHCLLHCILRIASSVLHHSALQHSLQIFVTVSSRAHVHLQPTYLHLPIPRAQILGGVFLSFYFVCYGGCRNAGICMCVCRMV